VAALHQQLDLGLVSGPQTQAKRSDALYGTHAYHTKVPPGVAASYIATHCLPDGLVVDPFCGSGMTGVGALLAGRRAHLSDLSPAAVHIARNYCMPCSLHQFDAAVTRIIDEIGQELRSLYRPTLETGFAQIEHVVWSDIRACPSCGHHLLLWDHRESGLRQLTCPACKRRGAKSEFAYTGEHPVQTSVSTPALRRHIVRTAADGDVPDEVTIPAGRRYPSDPFDQRRPMWRRSHADMGISTVADFFSRRNLAALALLWEAAGREDEERVRSALQFSITAIVNRASRRYQWHPKRPTNVLGGTLYISSLRYEWNVLSLWKRKTAAVRKLLSTGPAVNDRVHVQCESATALSLEDGAADYCFCDPPFGAHIVYSDASLLWEAWLGRLTPREDEAIVVQAGDQRKSVERYEDLLRQSFMEIHRVLKPGALATVVFQATSEKIWAAIVRAGADAGLSLVDVATLNKGQPSFKQIKGTQEGERVAQSDVVLTFAKATTHARLAHNLDVVAVMRKEIARMDGLTDGGAVGHLYAVVAAARLRSGLQPLQFDEVSALLTEHFPETAAKLKKEPARAVR
jgi:16S rRNA G966 N2-methylase RsmD